MAAISENIEQLGLSVRGQKIYSVELDELSLADSPRACGVDPEHVMALAESARPLPPIIVHRPTMRVIDGRHRLLAARDRGQTSIDVQFFDGDEDDAFVMAVEANVAHGLPLTQADRKRAAARIIASHPHWSDRMISAIAGIAAGTVAEIRRRTQAGEIQKIRIGQDGRVRPLNGAEGRRRAGQLLLANPDMSLRQVARQAGISPETVRDVRNRLQRGEDPVLAPRRTAAPAAPIGRIMGRDRAVVVERLKADPALRSTETGRTLLRLLNLHAITAAEWEDLAANVPAHCSPIVAHLAEECARLWTGFASQVEHKVAKVS